MKRLTIFLFLFLAIAGCSKGSEVSLENISIPAEPTSVPASELPTAIPLPTSATPAPVVVSPAESPEEQVAQSMERTVNYKIDVYDIRLFTDNPYGLDLMADSGYPTAVIIMEISLEDIVTPVERKLFWEAAKAGIKRLMGPTGVTGVHIFVVFEGTLQVGEWCPVDALGGDGQDCQAWRGLAPLPPEMTRFIGF